MSAPLVKIATCSIALGVVVMVVSICVLRGFQGEIRRKAVGFGAHMVVTNYAMGNTYEETPILTDRPEVQRILGTKGVKHLQFVASKGGMVKTEDQIHGIILKGVCPEAGVPGSGGYDFSPNAWWRVGWCSSPTACLQTRCWCRRPWQTSCG